MGFPKGIQASLKQITAADSYFYITVWQFQWYIIEFNCLRCCRLAAP